MMEGLTKTDIVSIPSQWRTLQFREVFEIIKSHSFSRNKLTTERTVRQVHNIHYGDIHSKFSDHHLDFDVAEVPFIIDEFLNASHREFLKDGDIIIADVSEDLIDIGKCVELKNIRNRKVIGGLHTIVARAKSELIEKGYGAYIFIHPEVISELRSIATGMSVYGISKGNLKKVFIPLPPLSEQHKIGHVLNTVQQAIEKQEQLIRTTTELKKALMQKFFTEGLYGEPQKETEIGLVPESWEIMQLGDIAQVTSGGTPSRTEKSFWEGGTIPWIKTGEINYCEITNVEEYITEEGLKNSSARLLKKGTLLMAMYGQGITRGKVAILGIDATVNQACAAIIPKNENQLQSNFLYYYFEKSYDFIRNLGHGANQKNLSGTIIKSIEISFPKSLKEQNEIIKTLKLMDKKIQFHQKKKQNLTDLFKTLLHQLMTGQIRVHDIDFDKYEASEKEELSLAAESEAAYETK